MKVECLKCGDTIHSKHRRDFVACRCGKVSVDGGNECPRIKGSEEYWRILVEK